MQRKRPADLLLLSMIAASYPCLTGLATCSPIAPPPLPAPRSLEKADQHDVIVSAFGGGGVPVCALDCDKSGGGGGVDVEYRPDPTVGITGDILAGRGGSGGDLPDQTLVQCGLGINYYFFPTKKLKFYPFLVEFRMDMSHLGNRSFTISPSAGLTAGFYFWHIEFSNSFRIGLGLPVVEGEAVRVVEDSRDVSNILQTFYFEADANLWVHFGRLAIGVFSATSRLIRTGETPRNATSARTSTIISEAGAPCGSGSSQIGFRKAAPFNSATRHRGRS